LKDRREPLSPAMRMYLELGLGALHAFAKASRPEEYESAVYFTPEVDRAAAWQAYGEEITADWAAGHAGTRPWGWWQFVASAPRTCLEGAPYVWKAGVGDWVWRQEFGLPGRPQARRPGAKPERLVFESQAVYLRRLDLLIPGEAERIPAEALEPEIVEIPELPALERLAPAVPAPALASKNGAARRPR
jgi:hypothetical protein